MHIDLENQVFAVLDGMGGAMAGEVASSTARDVLAIYVRDHAKDMGGRELLEAAIQAGNRQVHREAKRREDRQGMGTTVVACLIVNDSQAIISHVGDSRAYLWRDGRMRRITRDHTIVADLLAKKIITPSEAEHHPYNNVLSRNLGSKPRAKIDTTNVSLEPGDRLLLCSDGLTGYASSDAIEQILGGKDTADNISHDLIALALRGGGGDNITALVIDIGRAELPEDTQVIRTSGAVAWWRRREMFLAAARRRGLCESPVCSVLSPDEALEIVAGNLCEAIFHDLEQTTGINVWTYAENLAKGWFDQEGDYEILRDLLDILREAAGEILSDIEAKGEPYALGLDIAVTRGLTVAEMAIGGLLADRLRTVEAELVELRAHKQLLEHGDTTAQTLIEHPTVPYMSSIRVDPATPEVVVLLEQALARATKMLEQRPDRPGARDCLDRAHAAAMDPLGPEEFDLSGSELVQAGSQGDKNISLLFDAIDHARRVHLEAVGYLDGDPEARAAAMRRLAIAHRSMMLAVAAAVVEISAPVSEELHDAVAATAELRIRVGKGEVKLAELERQYIAHKLGTSPGGRSRGRL